MIVCYPLYYHLSRFAVAVRTSGRKKKNIVLDFYSMISSAQQSVAAVHSFDLSATVASKGSASAAHLVGTIITPPLIVVRRTCCRFIWHGIETSFNLS